MGHFAEFYSGQERERFRRDIEADPRVASARDRVGDLIGRAGRDLPAGPSVRRGLRQHVCSALIHVSGSIGGDHRQAPRIEPAASQRLGLPAVMWLRAMLAVALLLLATYWAGTFETPVSCTIEVPAGAAAAAGAAAEPAKLACQQIVKVSQSHVLAAAAIGTGLVLLLLEAAAILARTLSRVPLLGRLGPPAWLDPYARETTAVGPRAAPGDIVVDTSALDQNLQRAFDELDKARACFHEPQEERGAVPLNVLSFLQSAWSYRRAGEAAGGGQGGGGQAQGDLERLDRHMANIEGMLRTHGIELVIYNPGVGQCFEVVEDASLAAPETTLPAVIEAKTRRVLIQGQAFVPRR